MTYIAPLVALAALFASVPVWAQSETTGKEITPSAFLGVDLRGDFLTQTAECPADTPPPNEPCRVATGEADRFEVRGLPYLPISPGYKLHAIVTGRSISKLLLTGSTSNFYLVKELLLDQLGEPASTRTNRVQLTSGASYETEVYRWSANGVTVDFAKDIDNLSHYTVIFTAPTDGAEIGQNALANPATPPIL